MNREHLRVSARAYEALGEGRPVVALETTVIAHGLPRPLNLETARACEQAIERAGATAATIGIVEGVPTIGLSEEELIAFSESRSPEGRAIAKVGLNNFAAVMLEKAWGATTVAASLRIASLGGVRVFSTGGIGGVHRGAADTFDVSADLTALSRWPVICVCAGAKAILDLAKTVEYIETLGIPVIGYGTDEFPAFYSRRSGLGVDLIAQTPAEAAEAARLHWESGGQTAVLVCAPVPEEAEIPNAEIERAVERALSQASRSRVRAKAITPFLLSEMEKLTAGDTLKSNRALLLNNAEVAARIAACLSRSQ